MFLFLVPPSTLLDTARVATVIEHGAHPKKVDGRLARRKYTLHISCPSSLYASCPRPQRSQSLNVIE
jgi:hypothetical protein